MAATTPDPPDDEPRETPAELYRPADHYTRDHDAQDPGVPDEPRVRGAQRGTGGEGHPGQPEEPPGGPGT